uniref:Uncharacterized protein LOC111101412 isoform X6 n=1 Tax=Crassostrea virginica TaxID=6565 RepID=A0A8B8ADS4_CRAVI|nr:uncharacterized protein LOC111101412 isoform X6 [Crassostrea virginica]
MADKFEENFLRTFLLVMKFGTMVLQQQIVFELYQKWQTVLDFLKEKKHDILHLTLGKHNCCVSNCQTKRSSGLPKRLLSVMYQNVNRSCATRFAYHCSCYFTPKTDVSTWDITLTSRLLLEYFVKDPSLKQDIENLRAHRNCLCHPEKPGMDEKEFGKIWGEVSCTIKDIARKCEQWFSYYIEKEVDFLECNPISSTELDRTKDVWMKINKADGDELTELPNLISELISSLHKENTEMKNITWYAEYSLQSHCKKKDYTEPERAMKHSLKQLEEYKTICVVGNAGSGKTRFCLELMSQFQKKHPDLIALILTDSNEWRKLEFNQKTIIFIDDVIGQCFTRDEILQSQPEISIIAELLKRPEGPFMFLSENGHGRTPVQCRESYEKIKKLWVKRTCVKWSDDNFIHWY